MEDELDADDGGRYFAMGMIILVTLAIVGTVSIVRMLRELVGLSKSPAQLRGTVAETREVGVQTDAEITSASGVPTAEEGPYRARTVAWMRGELRQRGMPVSGLRCDLVRRLRFDDTAGG